jgi:hypothetical protein
VSRTPSTASATTVALSESDAESIDRIMAALPDPATLPSGALVIVPSEIRAPRTLTRSVRALFGRPATVARAWRCTALVARGYVDVGAAEDEERGDLAWGYAPPATEPCSDS